MNAITITIIVTSVLAAIIITTTGIRFRRRKYENKLVPYVCSGQKIFLRRSEIPKFENASRKEKRRLLGSFKAQIKKGNLIEVWEKGEIVGYTSKKHL